VERTVLDGGVLMFSGIAYALSIVGGLLSGWGWTAFLGTLINAGEAYVAGWWCTKMGIDGSVLSFNAQGDDDQFTFSTLERALCHVLAMQEMDFQVNNWKTFISGADGEPKRDEYLRQVIEEGVVAGYPARAIQSILWRNPVTRDPSAGEERFREQANQWNLFYSRGMQSPTTIELMLTDLARGNGMSEAEVMRMLNTPATLGGLGVSWLPPGEMGLRFISVRGDAKRVAVRHQNGLQSANVRAEELGYPLSEEEKGEVVAGLLGLEVAEVERRLTQVEIPRRGFKLTQLVGTSPLRAIHSEEIPSVYSDKILQKAIDNRDWMFIQTVWVTEEQRAFSIELREKARNRVWIAWLKDDLPGGLPLVMGYRQEVVSVIYNELRRAAWTVLNQKSRFNWPKVVAAMMVAESTAVGMVKEEMVRLGG
jgi:hypothetical protein